MIPPLVERVVIPVGGVAAVVELAAHTLRWDVGIMHVPVVYEHEKGPFRNGLDPVKGPVVQLLLGDGGVKEMVQAWVDQVFIAAPEPDALPKQGVHRTGLVTLVQQKFRKEGRSAGQLG